MRVRKKAWAESELQNNPNVLLSPTDNFGKWSEYFGNKNPIHVEIGCGKGGFLIEAASINPEINYIGIERQTSVAAVAARKLSEEQATANIRFACDDVKNLPLIFDCGEIQRIFINFCDPWPKKKWAKRRLTHRGFISVYEALLKDSGEIFFKTDNRPLFEFSLNEFCDCDWLLHNISLDLHSNKEFMRESNKQNIMTEYERKFSSLGYPIYRLEAQKRQSDDFN